jgi:small-conductance mechanosensitive channel
MSSAVQVFGPLGGFLGHSLAAKVMFSTLLYFSARHMHVLSSNTLKRWHIDPTVAHFMSSVLQAVAVCLGLLHVTDMFDLKVSVMQSFATVAGLTAGFAGQSVLANFVAGEVLAQQRLHIPRSRVLHPTQGLSF